MHLADEEGTLRLVVSDLQHLTSLEVDEILASLDIVEEAGFLIPCVDFTMVRESFNTNQRRDQNQA
jgi:hypothetical protein